SYLRSRFEMLIWWDGSADARFAYSDVCYHQRAEFFNVVNDPRKTVRCCLRGNKVNCLRPYPDDNPLGLPLQSSGDVVSDLVDEALSSQLRHTVLLGYFSFDQAGRRIPDE